MSTGGAESAAMSTLQALGLDPGDPSACLRALAPDWGARPEAAEAALVAAGVHGDATTAALLGELATRAVPRALRRALRQALHRLARRGFVPPADEKPAPALATPLAEVEAWITPIDPSGHQLLWLARRISGGNLTLSAVVHEDGPLRELGGGEGSRRELREAQAALARDTPFRLVMAPAMWVLWRIGTALDATPDRSRWPQARTTLLRFGTLPSSPPPHPIHTRIDASALAGDPEALARSATVLDAPEARAWLLPPTWLESTLDAVGRARQSLLVVSPAQQNERVGAALESGVATILDPPERRDRLAKRLEDTAWLMASRDALDLAQAAVAAAGAARAGRPIADIPALAELTRQSLLLALRGRVQDETEASASSLVLTPAQAAAEAARHRHRP